MSKVTWLDFSTKAKKMGVTDGVLRAKILSGEVSCFAYLSDVVAIGGHGDGEFLLPSDGGSESLARWIDMGSPFRDPSTFNKCHRRPEYKITGWVMVDRGDLADLFAGASGNRPQFHWIWIFNLASREAIPLLVYSENDFYPILTIDDLYFADYAMEVNNPDKEMSPQKERSYLGVISAMRALLRHKDGAGFPSDAKIIDQLTGRYGTMYGVSKRNLEAVFGKAAREIDKPEP